MASTQKKPASGSRSGSAKGSGSRSGGSRTGGSRSGSARSGSRGRSAAKNTRRPVRREVAGIVFLVLALCVLVSYFTEDGWLIALLPALLKGLFGFGFYLIAPALAVGGWILLTHRGRPVALRTACALLVPYLFGGLCHMLFCRQNLTTEGLLPKLWSTGRELLSGGVLSGGTAHGFMAVLGKPASVIIFCLLILVLLLVAFQVKLSTLIRMWKERDRLDYRVEDYEDDEEGDDGFFQPVEAPRTQPRKKREPAPARPEIDIPLDEEPARRKGIMSGFFKPKDKGQMTPADVLGGDQTSEDVPAPAAPAQAPAAPAPEPIPFEPEPTPITEPAAPAPGPISMSQSDCARICVSWSTRTTEFPSATRSRMTPVSPAILAGCRPMEGSSRT